MGVWRGRRVARNRGELDKRGSGGMALELSHGEFLAIGLSSFHHPTTRI